MTILARISASLIAVVSADIACSAPLTESVDCGTINVPGTGAQAGFWMETAPKARRRVLAAVCGWDFEKCSDVAIIRGRGPHALSWDGTTLIVHGSVDPISLTKRVFIMDNRFASVKYVRRMPSPKNSLWLDRRNCRLRGPIVGM